jgi:hypothetical protein
MGYTTTFSGRVTVSPPLNAEEITYLTKFNETRRMECAQGPYYVDRGGFMGQDHSDPLIIEYNQPPRGQPGLWCQWCPTEDGTAIEWDGGEKFYDAEIWMQYLIDHFLRPGAFAPLPFLQKNHTVAGTIDAQGEDPSDRWQLIVEDNKVRVRSLA